MRSPSALALCLPALLAAARPSDPARTDALFRDARAHLAARAFHLGLDARHDFAPKRLLSEGNADHVRLRQTYQGVPVFGGEAIVHWRHGAVRDVTDALVRGLHLSVRPSLGAPEALASAHAHVAPRGPYATDPKAELVIATPEGHTRPRLVYHVHTELENGAEETRHTDLLVDAHSGEILESWNSLKTGGVTGTGRSQWYGTVSLSTNSSASGYELRDMTRGTGGAFGANATTNLNLRTNGTGTIFTDADNAWGDGLAFAGDPAGENAQTAAVDGHRGVQATWDFYGAIFGRNGIDGLGTATYSRMHYSSGYDNAFWSDSCFCMTYGDGAPPSGSYGEADLDTCGHEVTHGVTAALADLVYRKEPGGLNEATSDILGTMVEFWTLGGGGPTIPDQAGSRRANGGRTANYKLFENSWGHAYPNEALRWMHKPSRDGGSPDFWYPGIGRLDVHYSSGVANHFFFLLAHGSQVDALSENEQSPLANGVAAITGIGNDKAARIWFRALSVYMTAHTDYAGARTATLQAAADLYGPGSAEAATVASAWLAVNVK